MVLRLYAGALLWLTSKYVAFGSADWTVVHKDTESTVDLWTKNSTGCPCPYDKSSFVCACCVSGGCNCGLDLPTRCSQCGLENRCLDLCNVTIDARSLAESSNKTFGQIKAPVELRGQTACWFKFRSGPGQRIELQIYRIVGMGQKNHTSCSGGGMSWYYDIDPRKEEFWEGAETPLRLCGLNERFFPPVTLFGDSPSAALILRFDEHFDRSRFLAYFSFTDSLNDVLGFQTIGGIRSGDSGCEYSFTEEKCKSNGPCTIASPGFPGLYPPNRVCKYSISTDSPFTVIRLHFMAVSFSESLCMTDDVLIFSGSTKKQKLVVRLCGRNKTEFRWHGPDILVEFRSGGIRPALEYNGFKATIHFEDVLKSQSSPGVSEEILHLPERVPSAVCDYAFRSSNVRTGIFTSETSAWRVWPAPCTLHFIGNANDTVSLNLMKFNLKGPDCRSYMEVFDIPLDVRWPSSPVARICSSSERKIRTMNGFNTPQIYKSRGRGMALRFKLDPADGDHILEGAFAFHKELKLGELQTDIANQIDVIDGTSGDSGQLVPVQLSFVHWNFQTPLKFVNVLQPAENQTATVEFHLIDLSGNSPSCVTDCGRGGCICRWINPLAKADYILVQDSTTNSTLLCLCGKPTNFLPLRLTSNRGVTISAVISSYSWPYININYNITWRFRPQGEYHGCYAKKLQPSSGILQENRSVSDMLLYPGYSYYFRSCSWLAQMEEGEQLIASISTSHAGPCSDWNTTFSLLDTTADDLSNDDQGIERVLKIVCPDQAQNMFVIPPMVQQIRIRLTSYTMVLTDYRLQWQTTQYIIPTPGDRALSPHSTESGQEVMQVQNKSSDSVVSNSVSQAHCYDFVIVSVTFLVRYAQSSVHR